MSSPATFDKPFLGKSETADLMSYELKDGFIQIEVVSYGCTFFTSFEVVMASRSENAIAVISTKPDACGMKPRIISLQYSYKHFGLDPDAKVQVENPIRSFTSTAIN